MAGTEKDRDMETPLLGSAGWVIEDHLPEQWLKQIRTCDATTNWKAVESLCSSLRGGKTCEVSQRMTKGTKRLVKLVEFEDGVKWVACITMEPIPHPGGTSPSPPQYSRLPMKSELAAYNFLREKTSIPIPEIFASDPGEDNAIGAPYVIMSYVHGSSPDDFAHTNGHPGTEEQFEHLLQQMAKIMVVLAQYKFDRIGSLYQNEETKEYYIGVDIECEAGPFENSVAYYNALSMECFKWYSTGYIANNLGAELSRGFELPLIFNNLFPILADPHTVTGPFHLTNMDFGFHNILIDEDFNIKAVVDCDSIMSAPIQSVAQYPDMSKMERVKPGITTARPLVARTYERWRGNCDRFRAMLTAAEQECSGSGEQQAPIADHIETDGSLLVAGLNDYFNRDDHSNQGWVKSYWYMYYRHIKGAKHALNFREILPPMPTGYNSDGESINEDGDTDGEGSEEEREDQEPTANEEESEDQEPEPATNEKSNMQPNNREEDVPQGKCQDIVQSTQDFSLSAQDTDIPARCKHEDKEVFQERIPSIMVEGRLVIEEDSENHLAIEEDTSEDDDDVEIITCDAEKVNRLKLLVKTSEDQVDKQDIADVSSEGEDGRTVASDGGVKITIEDIDRFEDHTPEAKPAIILGDRGNLKDEVVGDVGKVMKKAEA